MNLSSLRWKILLMMAVSPLAACDTMDTFLKKDMQHTTVIKNSTEVPAKMEAVRAHGLEVQKLQGMAETAFNAGDLDGAEQAYQSLDKFDPGNLRVAEGLRRIEARRRHPALLEEARSLVGKSDADDDRAAALLRDVLVENPDNDEARTLYRNLTEQHAAKRAEAMRKKLAYANPVTLEFRDVPIKTIIEALAKGTGINIIVDKDVPSAQKATLFVKNVSLEDAIDLLAQTNQLQKKVLNEKSVILYPNTVLKLREYQDLVIRSFYLEYADPKTVSGLLKSMLGVKQVQTDDRLPMIMIKDAPEIMTLVEKLIASQDVPDPEVMLEFEVLEIKRSNSLNTGVTWPNQLTVIGSSTGTDSASQLTLKQLRNLNSSGISVSPNPSIVFSGADSDANLLANPRVRIKNKEKASIHIGDRIPVITSNVSSTGVSTENVQYIDVGLKLEAEPLISLGGDVTLKLNLDVGSLGTQFTTKNGAVVYQIGTRRTSTQLRLRDGETQVMAGLISDEDRKSVGKLPGLGDIPLIGRLFSNHGDSKAKTEIVLSVTPHIIRERRSPQADTSEYWSGSEGQPGRNFTSPNPVSGIPYFAGTPIRPPPTAVPPQNAKPQGLNIPFLPPGMNTPLESGPEPSLESSPEPGD
ncbi:MAG: secretin and TonB N-terminal domain-containing protein [Methylophilaceae bacterium]